MHCWSGNSYGSWVIWLNALCILGIPFVTVFIFQYTISNNRCMRQSRLNTFTIWKTITHKRWIIFWKKKLKKKLKVTYSNFKLRFLSTIKLLCMHHFLQTKKDCQVKMIPFIYLCATMWHESELEMNTLLRSIFRWD